MKSWMPVLLRSIGVVGALLAVAVGCSFDGVSAVPPDPPHPNELFEGCFKGEAVEPDSGGTVLLVLEKDVGSDPANPLALTLRGCLELEVGVLDGAVMMAGMTVEAEPERAVLSGMFDAATPIDIEIVRSPAGEVPAESVTIEETNDRFRVDVTEVCDETVQDLCPAALAVGRGGGV